MKSVAIDFSRNASVRRFDEIDWDFPDQLSDSIFSDIHWHPCRFPSQIPAITIGRLTSPGDIVLDPFAGSGTTLVEAQRLGRRSLGIDINPIACLIARSKTMPFEASQITSFIRSTKNRLLTRWDDIEPISAPPAVQLTKWYTRATRSDLQRLWKYIQSYRGPFDILLKSAFSGILMPACRETRHWGYICDNTAPIANRERDVRTLFCDILDKFDLAYKNRALSLYSSVNDCEVIEGNAATVLESLADRMFSCFVTSPPYFGVADYVKAQRLSMEWFEFEIEPSRQTEIGARSKRHRKTAATDYLSELSATFVQVYRTLKRGGWGIILYGQSPARPSGKDEFVEQLRAIGFRLELEKLRQIREMRRQFPSLKDEFVILVRKP